MAQTAVESVYAPSRPAEVVREGTSVRHLLSLTDVGPENLPRLIDHALSLANKGSSTRPLKGKIVGIYFRRASTRTRTAFTTPTINLGGRPMAFGPTDLQISTEKTTKTTTAEWSV